MFKKSLHLFATLLLMLLVVNCAKRGSPTGGPKDEDPPVFVRAEPANYSTNFEGDEIRIYFDEFIKLKDLQKNLIISPPMSPTPIITPLGGASKFIKIEITDTLIPNTTYVFNFGRSVVDNNEENPYSYFKYVMSTGDYIDSLTVSGQIEDELLLLPDEFVTVMLYEVDSTYTDSIIYRQPPRYVTNTLDSSTTFTLTNLREGTYKLAALKDEASNYTFQPDKDKVAFYEHYINVPTDSLYRLTLFSEEPKAVVERPRFAAAQRVNFPIQGRADSITLEILNNNPDEFTSLITRKGKQDTLQYWYKPAIEADSLNFIAQYRGIQDTLTVRTRNLQRDSLYLKALNGTRLKLQDSFKLESSIPITQINDTLIKITKQDSVALDFTTSLFPKKSQLSLNFETEENQRYRIQILPEALIDFYGQANDTLQFNVATQELSDFGELEISLINAYEHPYIVQLVTEEGNVQQEQYGPEGKNTFLFNLVTPGQYYVRFIVDENANKLYDSGNYLERRQPEKVIYYPKLLDVRAGWFPKETFTLEGPAPAENDPDLPEN